MPTRGGPWARDRRCVVAALGAHLRCAVAAATCAMLAACGGGEIGPSGAATVSNGDAAGRLSAELRSPNPPPTTEAGAAVQAARPVTWLDALPGLSARAVLQGLPVFEPTENAAPSIAIRFAATVNRSASVGQVNQALRAVGGRIVGARPVDHTLLFEVDDAESLDIHSSVVSRLQSSLAFESVAPLN